MKENYQPTAVIADDNPFDSILVEELLKQMQVSVIRTSNKDQLVKTVLEMSPPPFLVISDTNMDLDVLAGIKAAKELREAGHQGYIVVHSGHYDFDLEVKAIPAGANAFLDKKNTKQLMDHARLAYERI